MAVIIREGVAFTTGSLTLSGATYEAIAITTKAKYVRLYSASEFTYGESDSATGNPAEDIILPVQNLSSVYVKGETDQVIYYTFFK